MYVFRRYFHSKEHPPAEKQKPGICILGISVGSGFGNLGIGGGYLPEQHQFAGGVSGLDGGGLLGTGGLYGGYGGLDGEEQHGLWGLGGCATFVTATWGTAQRSWRKPRCDRSKCWTKVKFYLRARIANDCTDISDQYLHPINFYRFPVFGNMHWFSFLSICCLPSGKSYFCIRT